MPWPGSVTRRGTVFVVYLVVIMFISVAVRAAEHRIDRITILDHDTVLIHFDTLPNREYVLQYINRLSCTPGSAGCNSRGIPTNWQTLATAPPYPEPLHYIVPDTRAAGRRYYRLRVRTF